MKRVLLVVFFLFTFFFLLFSVPVLARCFINSSDPPSLNCPPGTTCQSIPFPATTGPACTDPNSENCWCVGGANYVPPAVNLPPLSPAQPNPPTANASTPSFDYAKGSCSGGTIVTDSRPNECVTCTQTNKMTAACATTFKANDDIPYTSHGADFFCARPDGGQQAYIKGNWDGTISVDANEAKIPFVGKKEQEDEQKYLADYFEGTAYYSPQIDLTKCQTNYDEECQKQMNDIFLKGGVWPKLAPLQLQDDYKRQMVKRAQEGSVHDYKVKYAGEEANLTEFASHLKPSPKDYKTPDAWQQNLQNWEKSDNAKWSTLWTALPMFSREDTPGSLIVDPKINPPPQDSANPRFQNIVEKVPHVARLYEATQALQKLLIPIIEKQNLTTSNNPSVILSASEGSRDSSPSAQNDNAVVLGESTGCPASYLQGQIENIRTENGQIKYGLRISRTQAGQTAYPGTIGDIAINGPNGYHMENLWKNQDMYFDSTYAGADAFMPTPDSLATLSTYSWNITKDYQNCKEQLTVKTNVNAPPAPPPPSVPSCTNILAGAPSAKACSQTDYKQDSNPNDTLCCGKANIALSATDTFANQQYDQSEKCFNECDKSPEICEKRCNKGLNKPVYRNVEINLYHPYLRQIWEQTTKATAGIFNIFRIGDDYGELPAITKIKYDYTPTGKNTNQASPQEGDLYFPYLGSIQEAKEKVLQLLNLSGGSSGQGSSGGGVPGTTLNYVIPYHDSTQIISQNTKEKVVIPKVKQSWPGSQIETNWDKVYQQAISHGFNPAFVLALWIEESGANGVNNAWGLGCGVYSGVAKDIDSQLSCLFNVKYKNDTFQNFMCQYSQGENYPCTFTNNANFPGNVKNWYDQIAAP